MFARIVLVFALLGGWVTFGVTPASAVGPSGTGHYSKPGMINSSVGGPTKRTGYIGSVPKPGAVPVKPNTRH